jgi:hypothetical protein
MVWVVEPTAVPALQAVAGEAGFRAFEIGEVAAAAANEDADWKLADPHWEGLDS